MIIKNGKILLAAGTVLLLSACSQNSAQKAEQSATSTTTVTYDEATGTKTTTTVEKVAPGAAPGTKVQVNQSGPHDVSIDVSSDDERANATAHIGEGGVHVNAPGFNLDRDKSTGSLHINTPFLKIDKNPGGRTSVNVDLDRGE